jgi:hypothetical protein
VIFPNPGSQISPYSYASDEDIALKAPADFPQLVPRSQVLARGQDGSIGAGQPWLLASPSIDFQAFGVSVGCVLMLVSTRTPGPKTELYPPGPGELFAVDSVAPGICNLRRIGQAAGVGQPPMPGQSADALPFVVATLGPQIARASRAFDRRFGVCDLIAGRRHADLFDPSELTDAVVLQVLIDSYNAGSRDSGTTPSASNAYVAGDSWRVKALACQQELDDLIARVSVNWVPILGGGGLVKGDQPTSRFFMRLER